MAISLAPEIGLPLPDGPLDTSFLETRHPVWSAWWQTWQFYEDCFFGGEFIKKYLRAFEWERGPKGQQSYLDRQLMLTWMPFGRLAARMWSGHLFRKYPGPDGLDFGTLGKITEKDSPAQLAYYNIDGAGTNGSEWVPWWRHTLMRAMCFGVTYVQEESPVLPPTSREQEIRGRRPYLIERSPLEVVNYDINREDKELDWALIMISERRPRFDTTTNTYVGNQPVDTFILMVRPGVDVFGPQITARAGDTGAAFRFDERKVPMLTADGTRWSGWTFPRPMNGVLPLHGLYVDRSKGTRFLPANGVSMLSEMFRLSVGFMNVSSAADFEVIDAAKGIQYIIGITKQAYEKLQALYAEGSRILPVEVPVGSENRYPVIQDSSLGVIPGDAFNARLDSKRTEAQYFGSFTQSSDIRSSGVAREAGFAEKETPTLGSLASELQTTQNTALHHLEAFNNPNVEPTGVIAIPREFELVDPLSSVDAMFKLMSQSLGLIAPSATVAKQGMHIALKNSGVITDETDLEAVDAELDELINATIEAQAAQTKSVETQTKLAVQRDAQGQVAGITRTTGGTGGFRRRSTGGASGAMSVEAGVPNPTSVGDGRAAV